MATRVITYDQWREDYGTRGARWAGTQRDNGVGMFTALNMIAYENGLIGPRPGVRAYNWSSVPTGVLTGLIYNGSPGKTAVFFVDDDLYYVDSELITDTVTVAGTGTLDASSTRVEGRAGQAGIIYFTSEGDKSYAYDNVNDTLTDLSNTGTSPGGRDMVLHGERLYGGGGSPVWRVYYSEAADYDNWPALNYFDTFGYGGTEVNRLISLGSRLIIQTEDNLWLYQGVPGLDSLRKVIRTGIGVSFVPGAIVAQGDDLWYATRNGTLGWANGSVTDGSRWDHLELGTETVRGVYDPFEDVVGLYADGGAALLMREGVWTRHDYGVDLTNLAVQRSEPGTRQSGFVLTDGGGAETAATFYAQVNDFDRPGFESDTFARVGDASATPNEMYLYLPEYRPPSNQEITVREVKVDFVKWQTGTTATNHFDVTVRVLSLYDADGYRDSETLAFDEPGSATFAGTSGTEERANFSFGDQGSGSGFQILIDNIRGCAIRSVSVVMDETAGRSR